MKDRNVSMKQSRKGFTLAELLIVVAIIGVLVAISIPIFNNQLEKSREATDLANLRSAYAVGCAEVLTEESDVEDESHYSTINYVFMPDSGQLIDTQTWVASLHDPDSNSEAACIGKGTDTVGSSANTYGDYSKITGNMQQIETGGIAYDPGSDVSGLPIVVYIDWKNQVVLTCFWPQG